MMAFVFFSTSSSVKAGLGREGGGGGGVGALSRLTAEKCVKIQVKAPSSYFLQPDFMHNSLPSLIIFTLNV